MERIFSLKIPSDISDYSEYQILYKKFYVRTLIILGLPITFFFTIYNLYLSRYLPGAIVLLMFLVLCLFMYDVAKKSEPLKTDMFQEVLFRIFFVLFLSYLILVVGMEDHFSQTLWFLIFPVFIFFLTAIREALVWTVISAAILVYFLFDADFTYSPGVVLNLKFRLILIFAILAGVSFVTSLIIRSAIQNLFDNQKELRNANLLLKNEIEERRQAEAALRESEEKYRLHFNNVSDVIYTINTDFVVDNVSPSVEKALGYRPEELIGRPFQELGVLPPEYFAKAIEETRRVLDGDTIASSEYEFIAKDGRRKCADVSGSPFIQDGKIVAIISVARDITKRKQTEEEKDQLEIRLRQSQKMEAIGTLAGGVAHEFNNILGLVLGKTELALMNIPAGNPVKQYLEEIKSASIGAREIVQHILIFARKAPAQPKRVEIAMVVKEALKRMQATVPGNIEIRQEISCERQMVSADPQEIGQILINLCTNAAQSMVALGGVVIVSLKAVYLNRSGASQYDGIRPGKFIRLTVKDNGSGIDPDLIDRIFEPFFSTREVGQGTGMGLAVVYGLVKKYEGAIKASSRPSEGSVFEVLLPQSERV